MSLLLNLIFLRCFGASIADSEQIPAGTDNPGKRQFEYVANSIVSDTWVTSTQLITNTNPMKMSEVSLSFGKLRATKSRQNLLISERC